MSYVLRVESYRPAPLVAAIRPLANLVRKLYLIAGVLVVVAISLGVSRQRNLPNSWIHDFYDADCVVPRRDMPEKEWNETISTALGPVRVTGRTMVGGDIYVKFSGEAFARRVSSYHDYEYPADVRIDRQREVLWVATTGLAGGVMRVAHLYRYSLRARVAATIEVDYGDLATRCPVRE